MAQRKNYYIKKIKVHLNKNEFFSLLTIYAIVFVCCFILITVTKNQSVMVSSQAKTLHPYFSINRLFFSINQLDFSERKQVAGEFKLLET